MTLASTNEAVRRENCAKKTLIRKTNHAKKNLDTEKNNRHDPGGHERCKDSITIKEA
jgi:hypothetical protein